MKNQNEFSLGDDRQMKTLSPAELTAKRFFRNRLAVIGLVILAIMFLFSFPGGLISPYGQEQVFYREDIQRKEIAGVTRNEQFRFVSAKGENDSLLQAMAVLALGQEKTEFSYDGAQYRLIKQGTDFYDITKNGNWIGYVCKDVFQTQRDEFSFSYNALKAYSKKKTVFQYAGESYRMDSSGTVYLEDAPVGQISRLIIRGASQGEIPETLRRQIANAVEENREEFTYEGRHFSLDYDLANKLWSVKEETLTRVWDSYAPPSWKHPLGTDKNGMDMLTRLMYGGRVSLVIGFIVVLISALIGVVLGGVAGYFGGWTDMLTMRLVDIFYCVPTTPLLIILGAAMDAMRIDPQVRMLFLMLILGFLGWPGIARLVRGQILSLREQEFMTATEAIGLRPTRRIFRHLLPNVIPQLIVSCTMSLGSTILVEATLSFLGLGVKFPFASWGNIISDVRDAHVLTSYWFVWIPAGVCLVLAVLGFNFVGDGLRDAFDPKMKR